MTIDLIIIIQMIIAALAATGLYTLLGIIPGTDETSVLVPVTIVLVALGLEPLVILSFFIAAIVSLNLTDSIPTALTAIPGGVMATPLVESSQHLKEKGLTTTSIKKMTMGSLIGTVVAIPMALLIYLIVHLISVNVFEDQDTIKTVIKQFSGPVFLVGAIFLSLLSKNKKYIALLAIIPLAIIFTLAAKFSLNPSATTKIGNTPFFLSITTGPLLFSLVSLLVPKERKKSIVYGNQTIEIESTKNNKINALNILDKKEIKISILASILASLTFFLSPVGMTLLIGETVTKNIKDEDKKALTKVTAMNAVSNSAYLAGFMISLLVFSFPISPAALGPGKVFFQDSPLPDAFQVISLSSSLVAILIGVVVALSLTVFLSLKYSSKMTEIVFKYISHETVLILLMSLVFLLVFLEAGILGVFIIILVGIISGFLNKKGVNYGVQFMILYAAPFIISLPGLIINLF